MVARAGSTPVPILAGLRGEIALITALKLFIGIVGLGVGTGCVVFADNLRKDTAAWWLSTKGLWAFRIVGGGSAAFSLWCIVRFLKLV